MQACTQVLKFLYLAQILNITYDTIVHGEETICR